MRFHKDENIVPILEHLGVVFIKSGQYLSLREELVGPELVSILRKLQDSVRPMHPAIANNIMIREFGVNYKETFLGFDEYTPMASASIAQIYKAKIFFQDEYKEVAIKIQRVGIYKIIKQDLKSIKFLCKIFDRIYSKNGNLQLYDIVAHIEEILYQELDFNREAANASEMRSNAQELGNFLVIPKVYWEHTNSKIITFEWINGKKFMNIDDSNNKELIVKRIVKIFFFQVFDKKFFHGDLHPGNIFILPNDKIALVDFGITYRLPETLCKNLIIMIWGMIKRDYNQVLKAHIDAGLLPLPSNPEEAEIVKIEFMQACRRVIEPVLDSYQSNISLKKLMFGIMSMLQEFSISTDLHLVLLNRAFIYLDYLYRTLAPNGNLLLDLKEYCEIWWVQNYGVEQRIFRSIKEFFL